VSQLFTFTWAEISDEQHKLVKRLSGERSLECTPKEAVAMMVLGLSTLARTYGVPWEVLAELAVTALEHMSGDPKGAELGAAIIDQMLGKGSKS
jgi:hypothetical protein